MLCAFTFLLQNTKHVHVKYRRRRPWTRDCAKAWQPVIGCFCTAFFLLFFCTLYEYDNPTVLRVMQTATDRILRAIGFFRTWIHRISLFFTLRMSNSNRSSGGWAVFTTHLLLHGSLGFALRMMINMLHAFASWDRMNNNNNSNVFCGLRLCGRWKLWVGYGMTRLQRRAEHSGIKSWPQMLSEGNN